MIITAPNTEIVGKSNTIYMPVLRYKYRKCRPDHLFGLSKGSENAGLNFSLQPEKLWWAGGAAPRRGVHKLLWEGLWWGSYYYAASGSFWAMQIFYAC